ncbi:MAG: class I SAM-dependent methyltransferase [Acidobacteriota bacterium]
MQDDELRREWDALAPAWIREAREGTFAVRHGLLDPAMLQACGDVRGLSVLDCGCGEGRFSRILAGAGATRVLGIDTCDEMLRAARELPHDRVEYRHADAQDLRSIESGTFDLAVSYLNQCDLPDFAASTREAFRVLRSPGRFVVVNLHPMRSAVGGWQRDGAGDKQHVILDRYFSEGARRWRMMGCDFTNFHRTLATYVRGFLDAGFGIEGIIEPTVASEALALYPELEDELRVPNFILYALAKP